MTSAAICAQAVELLLAVTIAVVRPALVEMFQQEQVVYTGGRYDNTAIDYHLYVPPGAGPERPAPLIVWFHGSGEAGDDGRAHLRWLDRLLLENGTPSDDPFAVLALQCPSENPHWRQSEYTSPDDMVEVVMAAVRGAIEGNPIDEDRVYAMGVSNGGTAAWVVAGRHAGRFAAVVPMSASYVHPDTVGALTETPVWAFHNTNDPWTSVDYSREAVRRLRSAGGVAALTETPGDDHDSWTYAFRSYRVLDWVLAQRRGAACTNRPGAGLTATAVSWLSENWRSAPFVYSSGLALLLAWTMLCIVITVRWPQRSATLDARRDAAHPAVLTGTR